MSEKQQIWGNHLEQSPLQQNVLFCAGRDVQTIPMADEVLLPYDIWTNRAHSTMLQQQGIISKQQLQSILEGLQRLELLIDAGKFVLDPAKEDVHVNVEAFITEHYGIEVGGRMHTGRSRNDQATCDMRLYLRDAAFIWMNNVQSLLLALLDQAELHAETVMPGFTHYQPGMITTWGHWLCAYVQGLLRDLERLEFSLKLINRNPLGSAASFGTSWNIDRQCTTDLLAFDCIDTNTLDCITARWESEAQLAQSCVFVMNRLSVISQDLIFLTLPYIKMLGLDEGFVTGSSIMPQKKNPDFAEIIKSKASLAQGILVSLFGIQKGGLSGYNRDTQLTKYLIMDLIRECQPAPSIMTGVFQTLKVNTSVMQKYCQQGFMNAVDIADYLSQEFHFSFRECYNIVASAVRYSSEEQISFAALQKALKETKPDINLSEERFLLLNNARRLVAQRKHHGSPAPEQTLAQVVQFRTQLLTHESRLRQWQNKVKLAKANCI